MAENVFEAVVVHTGLPASIECELIVVPVFEGETTETSFFSELDAATGGEVGQAILRGEFHPNGKDCFITPVIGDAWKAAWTLVGVPWRS